MRHHTKDKGDLGVLKAKVDLYQKGFITLSPDTEHAPFDIAIYKDGKVKTVQVKYREVKNGMISVGFRTSWTDKHGTHTKHLDKDAVDIFCVYCPDTDKCYYFNSKDFGKSINLRIETPKNNQTTNIKFASDYCEVP
jgi:hypothetical protein